LADGKTEWERGERMSSSRRHFYASKLKSLFLLLDGAHGLEEKLLDGEKRITSRYVPFFSKEVRLTSLFRGGLVSLFRGGSGFVLEVGSR
jgi:hypothetical protein